MDDMPVQFPDADAFLATVGAALARLPGMRTMPAARRGRLLRTVTRRRR